MNSKDLKTIDINAKEWFDRVNGNSYFAAVVTLNYGMKDAESFSLPFQYGYDSHYIDIANQELIRRGIIIGERYNNGTYPALWRYCEENNIVLRTSKEKNCKQRELKNI